MNLFASLLDSRIRGVRIFEVLTFVCLLLLVLWVYLAKAGASQQRSQIADVEQRIDEEQRRVKLLRADAARLEQPARIEALSESVGLKPVDAAREASPETLAKLAAHKADPAAKTPAKSAKTPADPPPPASDAQVQGGVR
jgi:cell division protein FtsL